MADQIGTALFVVSQRLTTNANDTVSPGNLLHLLQIGADGTVSEPGAPLALTAPVGARPQGVAAISL